MIMSKKTYIPLSLDIEIIIITLVQCESVVKGFVIAHTSYAHQVLAPEK